MRRVEIRIDELVLRGVPGHQADQLVARIEAHLRRLARDTPIEGLTGHAAAALRPQPAHVSNGQDLAEILADRIWAAATRLPAEGGRR